MFYDKRYLANKTKQSINCSFRINFFKIKMNNWSDRNKLTYFILYLKYRRQLNNSDITLVTIIYNLSLKNFFRLIFMMVITSRCDEKN